MAAQPRCVPEDSLRIARVQRRKFPALHKSEGRLNVCMSYVSSYFHCVFSTKERRRLITPALRERLWPFLGGIARQNKMKPSKSAGWKTTSISIIPAATVSVAKACN